MVGIKSVSRKSIREINLPEEGHCPGNLSDTISFP